jgi:hypothetical protein
MQKRWCIYWCLNVFRASSCPSSGEQYKADNAYSVQPWPCSSPRVCCSTARAVHYRRCRLCTVLLMMGMMMPETCWDTNKYIIFSAYGWLFILLHKFTVLYIIQANKCAVNYENLCLCFLDFRLFLRIKSQILVCWPCCSMCLSFRASRTYYQRQNPLSDFKKFCKVVLYRKLGSQSKDDDYRLKESYCT